jgi:hypothetical protein
MNTDTSILAIYSAQAAAEAAVKELQRSGFNMKQLSIVGRDYQNEAGVGRRMK